MNCIYFIFLCCVGVFGLWLMEVPAPTSLMSLVKLLAGYFIVVFMATEAQDWLS